MKSAARIQPGLALFIAAMVIAAVAWRVISLQASTILQKTDPEGALSWHNSNPDALLAQALTLQKFPERAQHFARAALEARPLDGRPYRVLAHIFADQAGEGRAYQLFTLAARFAPRDIGTRAWLMEKDFRAGRLTQGLAHADMILRIRPQLASQVFPVLVAVAHVPKGRAPLVDLLAAAPPWRAGFWHHLSRNAIAVADISFLHQALARTPRPVQRAETEAWLERLIKDGRLHEAYPVWVGLLTEPQRALLGNVFDGGFETDVQNAGFGWRVNRIAGATVGLHGGNGVTGASALTVHFDGQRVSFRNVSQLLVLPPGHYQLTGRTRVDALRNDRGLQWTLVCTEKARKIGESDRFMGSSPWRLFKSDFSVPGLGCPSQWLRLELAARIPAERFVSGTIWFDDLQISRVPADDARGG